MLIHEVCKECRLTKKAVEYYVKQGLIHPVVNHNGYRNFNEQDVSRLKEISVLRKLDFSISEIKKILESNNKSTVLAKNKFLMDLKVQKLQEKQVCLEHLMNDYDIEKEIKYIKEHLDHCFTIKEKLVQAFPGTYAMFLAIHFGPFLNERINSPEKKAAYNNIVQFLDQLTIPKEIEEYIEQAISVEEDMELINQELFKVTEDVEQYFSKHENLEEYIQLRSSQEYQSTPAYQMGKAIREFQQISGYNDIFIHNLKILSSSYREYSNRLQKANEWMVRKYPEVANWYQEDK